MLHVHVYVAILPHKSHKKSAGEVHNAPAHVLLHVVVSETTEHRKGEHSGLCVGRLGCGVIKSRSVAGAVVSPVVCAGMLPLLRCEVQKKEAVIEVVSIIEMQKIPLGFQMGSLG